MGKSGQKFIARNRAPRVQIEFDVHVGDAQKKVQLPFVMGVMADLSGTPKEPLPPVAERKFVNVDADNFNAYLKSTRPRAAFRVPNTLTDAGGEISVDLTFESMDDFSPAAVAQKVEALNRLVQARTQLKNLLSYMDGNDKAEELIENVLEDPALMAALAAAAKPEVEPGRNGAAVEESSNG